jgi:hypothetical protein
MQEKSFYGMRMVLISEGISYRYDIGWTLKIKNKFMKNEIKELDLIITK